MVVEGAAAVNLPEVPKTFVFNSGGLINAFALRLIGGRYVWLTSALIDADTDAQVRFVIGHELGHHAAGHIDWRRSLLRFPGYVVPFLGAAYLRSREYTCDRVGAYLAQDLDAARSALQVLACGSIRLNPVMNPASLRSAGSHGAAGRRLHPAYILVVPASVAARRGIDPLFPAGGANLNCRAGPEQRRDSE